MIDSVSFFVYGIPAPAGSKTGFPIRRKDGTMGVAMAPSSKKTKPWMALVSAAARESYKTQPFFGPLYLSLDFFFPRPKLHYGSGRNHGILRGGAPVYHTVRPDLTKVIRATEDALTGIIWRGDQQVCKTTASKHYCGPDQLPGCGITVEMLIPGM